MAGLPWFEMEVKPTRPVYCDRCGRECAILRSRLQARIDLATSGHPLGPAYSRRWRALLRRLGIGWKRTSTWVRSLWEVHHIVPLIEGGTHDPSNLEILCLPCHKRETRELTGRMSARRLE